MGQTILLTGGSGVVGQALLGQATDETMICLMRRRPIERSAAQNTLTTAAGDICRPRLGLTEARYAELAAQVDWVIHAAAVTDFTCPFAELHQTNVEGTRNMLAFAHAARAKMIYVSTAFVHPRSGHQWNNYERSKREAERLVQTSGVPTTIVRPSIIIGDSETGTCAKQQGIHRVIRLLLQGILPAVPGSPVSRLDIVPHDRVAEAILRLVRNDMVGDEYWLTAGEAALPLEAGLEMVMAQASALLGKSVAKPQLVAKATFDRMMQQTILPLLPTGEQQRFAAALGLFPFMDVRENFPTSLPELCDQIGLSPLPDLQTAFQRNLDYVVRYNQERIA